MNKRIGIILMIVAMLEETKFTLAFTIQNGLVTRDLKPLLLPRVKISPDANLYWREPQFSFLANQINVHRKDCTNLGVDRYGINCN